MTSLAILTEARSIVCFVMAPWKIKGYLTFTIGYVPTRNVPTQIVTKKRRNDMKLNHLDSLVVLIWLFICLLLVGAAYAGMLVFK